MFLHSLLRTNPQFVSSAIELHQSGKIPANSYVLDVDTISENAKHVLAEARKHSLTVFPMTKQFGRNAHALKALTTAGVDSFVSVDMTCARGIRQGGFQVGHLGHLVQIPKHEIAEALSFAPRYWTVFSRFQAELINKALTRGARQAVLLRVYGHDDVVVPTHAGGFAVETIDADIDYIAGLPGIDIAGVTTYPSANFERLDRVVVETPNVHSMLAVAEKLRRSGVKDVQINMASELSTATISLAAKFGATQVEPGHAFTGTSPLQIFAKVPERQAMIYLSEISHAAAGGSFFFGGGLYECIGALEHTRQALVGRANSRGSAHQLTDLILPPNGVIDFYGKLSHSSSFDARPGDTVIVCTRPQAFFTRAYIVPVKGIHSGSPEVLGVWDINGFPSSVAPEHCVL
jgi:predicted amino acid racemase